MVSWELSVTMKRYLVITAPIGYERAEEQIKSFDLGLSFVKNPSQLRTWCDDKEVTDQESSLWVPQG